MDLKCLNEGFARLSIKAGLASTSDTRRARYKENKRTAQILFGSIHDSAAMTAGRWSGTIVGDKAMWGTTAVSGV